MHGDLNPVYPVLSDPLPIVLRVWENDFGLPSVDPECLELMALCKVHRVNIEVQHAFCPHWIDIPSIEHNNTVIKGPELKPYVLSLCQNTIDISLDNRIKSKLLAYKKYFRESFGDIFYFDCWLNGINYEHAIKAWYESVIPFPFHYFYLKKKSDVAKQRFKYAVGQRDPEKYLLKQHSVAARCLADFSTMLKDGRKFFFGDLPSSLDVTIYSQLAVALYLPLPDPHLQNLIKCHPALVEFVKNMTNKYFPDVPMSYKYVEPVAVHDDRASVKTVIIAGLFATLAMLFYACSIGLIHRPHLRSIEYH